MGHPVTSPQHPLSHRVIEHEALNTFSMCDRCAEPWNMTKTDCRLCELSNRLDRIIENGSEHEGINSTKQEAINHLIQIAQGHSH